MINTSRFCPFERIDTIINSLADAVGATSYEVKIGGASWNSQTHSTKSGVFEQNLAFSREDRISFLESESVVGEVVFYAENDDKRIKTLTVKHCLSTPNAMISEGTFKGKKYKNAAANGAKGCYPEILTSHVAKSFTFDTDDLIYEPVRPFFEYVLVSETPRAITIYGPASFPVAKKIGTLVTEDGPIIITSLNDRPASSEYGLDAGGDFASNSSYGMFPECKSRSVIIRCENVLLPFDPAVCFNNFAMGFINAELALKIWHIAAHLDKLIATQNALPDCFAVSDPNRVFIDLVNDGALRLKDDAEIYYERAVRPSLDMKAFGSLSAIGQKLLVEMKDGVAVLDGAANLDQQLAFVFARYLSLHGYYRYSDMAFALGSMMKSGMVVCKGGKLVFSEQMLKKQQGVSLSLALGSCVLEGSYEVSLTKDASSLNDGDVAIALFDLNTADKDGAEHCALVKKDRGELTVLYLPVAMHGCYDTSSTLESLGGADTVYYRLTDNMTN